MNTCSQVLKNIGLDYCSTSQGGIVEAWLTNWVPDIFTVSATTEGVPEIVESVSSAVTFYHYQFRKNTGNMNSTLNIDDANGINYVSTEVYLQFNKQETAKRTAVAALALGGLAGIIKDGNGLYWAIGVDEPCNTTSGTATTGSAKTDGNFYSVTIQDDYMSFPLEVPKAVAEAINVSEE